MTTVRANAGRLRGEPYENHAPLHRCVVLFFFFQAEDGIRDLTVTGVQTCALPIYSAARERPVLEPDRPVESQELPVALELFLAGVLRQEEGHGVAEDVQDDEGEGIGRASCRERGEISVVAGSLKKKKNSKLVDAG